MEPRYPPADRRDHVALRSASLVSGSAKRMNHMKLSFVITPPLVLTTCSRGDASETVEHAATQTAGLVARFWQRIHMLDDA